MRQEMVGEVSAAAVPMNGDNKAPADPVDIIVRRFTESPVNEIGDLSRIALAEKAKGALA
jgi:hypothetical protein